MSKTLDILASEISLRSAMLNSDVDLLDQLLDDELVFTAPDGQLLTKADDLLAHRSGMLKFYRIEVLEQHLRAVGDCMVVNLRADIAGRFGAETFGGCGAYTRVWRRSRRGWVVAAAHCSTIPRPEDRLVQGHAGPRRVSRPPPGPGGAQKVPG